MTVKVNRILLIDVEFDKQEGKKNSLQGSALTNHPLGLMYLKSAVNHAFKNIEVRIIHTVTLNDTQHDIGEILDDFMPDMVGLRSLSLFMEQFSNVARLVRKRRPEACLVGGGPYPSASPEMVLEDGLVDLVVIGEGEESFVQLLETIIKTQTLPLTLAGTAVLDGGKTRINPAFPLIADIDTITFPDYDSVNLEEYHGLYNHSYLSASDCAFIMGSRGCPYKCFYCHDNFGKRIRRRSAKNVVEEMKALVHSKGVGDFVFVDDTFNLRPSLGKETLRLIAKELPGIKLHFPNGLRADVFDDEYIDLFEKAGTVTMAMAIETATPRIQRIIGKNLDIDKAVKTIMAASQRFIMRVFFMVGFPSETIEEARNTLELAKKMVHVTEPMLSIMRVYPSTPIYDMLKPTPEQAKILERQSSHALVQGLFDDPQFYGDIFSEEMVPLRSNDIKGFQVEWLKNVVMHKERIRTSAQVVKKCLNDEDARSYYQYVYGTPRFSDDV
jgi:anaerobic magnesium-protoporphyrin IX monomethyl ester cyclase